MLHRVPNPAPKAEPASAGPVARAFQVLGRFLQALGRAGIVPANRD